MYSCYSLTKWYHLHSIFLLRFFFCVPISRGFATLFCLVSLCLQNKLRRAWYRQCTAKHKLHLWMTNNNTVWEEIKKNEKHNTSCSTNTLINNWMPWNICVCFCYSYVRMQSITAKIDLYFQGWKGIFNKSPNYRLLSWMIKNNAWISL